MKRIYCAILLALLVVSSLAAKAAWKKIRLESAGTISLPHSWNVSTENSAVIQNAYGQGVSCRTLLTAEAPNLSMSILMYWPYDGNNAQKFASDMADSLRLQLGTQSQASSGEMSMGTIRASSVTYALDGSNDQRVTAFVHGKRIFCLVSNYRHADEYAFSRMMRNIISRWQF